MKNIVLSFLLLLIIACRSDKNNMHVKGTIKGLKKGTVYLKKANDTAFVIIDSFKVNKAQNYNFEFSTNIEEPEAFTIELDKSTNKDNRITFFGYEGLTTINTSLKNFGYDVSINGSKEQKLLEEYITNIKKFRNQGLDILKQNLDSQIAKDELAFLASKKRVENHKKRKYLYTVNFALANKNSIVSPYIALTEIYDAKLSLLDTINRSLSTEVKASKYGLSLNTFIQKRNQ
jgi:hypothetical protein